MSDQGKAEMDAIRGLGFNASTFAPEQCRHEGWHTGYAAPNRCIMCGSLDRYMIVSHEKWKWALVYGLIVAALVAGFVVMVTGGGSC